ncbi:MAG: F0F1 ATP synthase subunit B' [Aestuariivita sp.]|nr:F0F1 ATP synthase subunit B' [Aestuariivita sp.]MCY4345798.1 F0F1 ATP synthase subunit B' [Aestuariivita sp.]
MAAETHDNPVEAVGMPQLDVATFPNQILWLLVALALIYLTLSRFALPRIASILANRRGTIAADLAQAEELKVRAQQAEEAYETALAGAKSEAQNIAAETRAKIQNELKAEMAKMDAEMVTKTQESEKRIEDIRTSANESVKDIATDAATQIVDKILGRVDQNKLQKAVDARVKG